MKEAQQKIRTYQIYSIVVALIGAALCGFGASQDQSQFVHSYLIAYLFFWKLSIGFLGLLLINHLLGGQWGYTTRPILTAGTTTIPLMGLLFIPIALDLPALYEWANPEIVAHDVILQHKAPYLNVDFFIQRSIGYFLLWTIIVCIFVSRNISKCDLENPVCRNAGLTGISLCLMFLTLSFAAFDWGMSLDPHWYSTIYGALLAAGGVVAAMALTLNIFTCFPKLLPLGDEKALNIQQDLGTLTFAFLMVWTYFAFSQYLIIWSGNLPEEAIYYQARVNNGWEWISQAIIVFHFAVPFFLLISRRNKRNPKMMFFVTCGLLMIHYVETFWTIAPSYKTYQQLSIHWLDITIPIAMGGIWMSLFFWQLKRRTNESAIKNSS